VADAQHGSNTHILHHAFEYIRPGSLVEAVQALVEYGDDARLLAGGTNLIVDMKLERCLPKTVIDISGLADLVGIREEAGTIRIGALTPIRTIALSPLLWEKATALAEAAAAFGSTQIAMQGTIGGNTCNGSPASDTVPALVALEAEAIVVGPEGNRTVAVGDLLDAPGRTRLRSGEILREIRLSSVTGTASAFLKLSRVRADLSKVSVAVRVAREGNAIRSVRIELGSVGPTVARARKTEAAMGGMTFSEDGLLKAARRVSQDIVPIDDVRSTADYRRKAAVALVFDAISAAWARAADGPPPAPRGTAKTPGASRGSLHLESAERVRIRLFVNGAPVELEVAPNELLLNVLRERLELTGSKYGCGIGECGACTIWVDGEPALGCLILAVAASGSEIRTIEGLAKPDGTLDPIQQAFIDENAFQCGYCTPGMLMMTKKLMDEIPEPTEDEVREYLKGNRCRCTGYASIVRAVNAATGPDKEIS